MQIICISRGTFSGGQEVAIRLAERLGYPCLSMEELMEAATHEGIPIGKLQMAMIKPGIFNERLAIERDHYLAFSTVFLNERAMENGLVYHGDSGHLVFPGVRHVFRVRLIADEEYRLPLVMQQRRLDREKARRFIKDVDEDRRRWIQSMYGVSWDDAANYDVTINLDHMSPENVASALMNMSQLPDFQMTPASRKAVNDLLLAAKVRVAIARDERTYGASVKVRADNGTITVTYMPQDARVADHIPEACKEIPGLKDIRTTMAMSNILWIQEDFHPGSEAYNHVVEIATKWNSAVELISLVSEAEGLSGAKEVQISPAQEAIPRHRQEYNGGIEDDLLTESSDHGNLQTTLNELALVGKSGGGRVIYGGQRQLIRAVDRSIPYALVVIGDVLKSKGQSARLRAMRDLRSFIGDHIKAPIVTADELESRYLFGKRDIFRFAVYLLISAVIYFIVFTHQKFILSFLAQSGWYAEAVKNSFLGKVGWAPKVVVSFFVFLLVPIIAYAYGTASKTMLKFIKME